MAAKPTVLIVGATGMMGSKIASAILNKGAMNITKHGFWYYQE
jgi:nucleoside-diphosphate-sugar epimerase